jgi:hypothetical protein
MIKKIGYIILKSIYFILPLYLVVEYSTQEEIKRLITMIISLFIGAFIFSCVNFVIMKIDRVKITLLNLVFSFIFLIYFSLIIIPQVISLTIILSVDHNNVLIYTLRTILFAYTPFLWWIVTFKDSNNKVLRFLSKLYFTIPTKANLRDEIFNFKHEDIFNSNSNRAYIISLFLYFFSWYFSLKILLSSSLVSNYLENLSSLVYLYLDALGSLVYMILYE